MSTVSSVTPVEVKKAKEPLLSEKNRKLLKDPINDSNPITVQVLGICSALAVTVQMKPSIVMALSVMVVTGFSNLMISAIRNIIPDRIRIIVQLVIVASVVILVDQVLKAFVYDVSKQLSVFVGLIITNCIVMGRLEAFAMGNKPWPSFLDGIGNGLGYGLILVVVSAIRELFGSGKLMGFQVVPNFFYERGYFNNGITILPPMALIIVGILIWIQRSKNTKLIENQ
jgi:Na+-transporting NADH:ubiquinone oxidoreductase subunit D